MDPVQDKVDQTLSKISVRFCIDTNILIELCPLDQIIWSQVAPNATTVQIVVPSTVGEQMDELKKKSGRLRRRAIEFSAIARKTEVAADGRALIRDSSPQVTLEFAPLYRRSDLDGDLYDLTDSDGRIVAEVARYCADNPDAVFLSDDSKPLRWARLSGLQWLRPPEAWRREDGPDERDQEILELKRALNPRPVLTISFPDEAKEAEAIVIEPYPKTPCKECVSALASAILGANRRTTREASIKRYGLGEIEHWAGMKTSRGKLTEQDLDRYEQAYDKFEASVQQWAESQDSYLGIFGHMLPIQFSISNSGDCAAERVIAECDLQGDFHFFSAAAVASRSDYALKAPQPPKPSSLNFMPHTYHAPESEKPHHFYPQNEPNSDRSTKHLAWRCEEFRHGNTFTISTVVRANRKDAKGAFKVRLSGADVAKFTIEVRPLICVSQSTTSRMCDYLIKRSELLTSEHQQRVRQNLATAAKACDERQAK